MKTLAVLLLAAATLLFVVVAGRLTEGFFGMSPGTLDQLASSHVPTEEDAAEEMAARRQIAHDLIAMTGSA
jgi:hypothetical protein